MANQINNSAKNTVVITVLKVEYAIMVSTKYRSNPRISPTARKISQIAAGKLHAIVQTFHSIDTHFPF